MTWQMSPLDVGTARAGRGDTSGHHTTIVSSVRDVSGEVTIWYICGCIVWAVVEGNVLQLVSRKRWHGNRDGAYIG